MASSGANHGGDSSRYDGSTDHQMHDRVDDNGDEICIENFAGDVDYPPRMIAPFWADIDIRFGEGEG